MIFSPSQRTHYINGNSASASILLAGKLRYMLSCCRKPDLPPVFVCIGSDRVTGDSLGPLVGSRLQSDSDFISPVYGTLEFPIHALNLEDAIDTIKTLHPENPVVAIDAALGSRNHQNYITIAPGSLCPGAGVNKDLMEVGDISITGIINTFGEFSQMVLQNTRLSVVMTLADAISRGILMGCLEEHCNSHSISV